MRGVAHVLSALYICLAHAGHLRSNVLKTGWGCLQMRPYSVLSVLVINTSVDGKRRGSGEGGLH